LRARWSRFAVALCVIALAALGIRIAFVVLVDPDVPPIGDASAYHLLANNLAHHGEYFRPFDDDLLHEVRPTAEYPPLFPVVLAVPARLGATSVEAQRIFMAFVGAGTVVLIGLLGRRVGGSRVGLVAAGLAAIYPMLFQSEGVLMAESVFVPLVVVTLLLAYRALDEPATGRFALLGVAIGLTTLARAEGLLLGVLLVVPMCWCLWKLDRGRRAALAVTALGIAVLVVAPWTIRNAVRLHAFVPVSNNVATLIDGANCDAVYGGDQLGLWRATFTPDGETDRSLPQAVACFEGFDIADPDFDEAEASDRQRDDGLEYARDHLGSLPKVAAVRWLRTFGLYDPSQQVDYESLEGRPSGWQWAGTVMYWVLVPFAIGGFVVLRRRRVPIWPLLAPVVAVSITAVLTYGQQRFRAGAEPVIIVAAAVALVAVVRAARSRAPTAPPARSQPAR
jgi:4-amino-4-deoxy-L-arabinose transferase-like glycosyltransferase